MNNQKHCQHWTAIKNEQPETLPTLDDKTQNKDNAKKTTTKKTEKLAKGKQFLLLLRDSSCSSKSSLVKVLSVKEERGKINIGLCKLQFVCS
jgi:uncharacterized ferredoxin-like protein